MKKIVLLQILLATAAFTIAAWVFIRVRPREVQNQVLQQRLQTAVTQNAALAAAAATPPAPKDPSPADMKQSRQYLRQGVSLFHEQKFDDAVALYNKALNLYPNDPYGLSLKGYALFRAGHIQESIIANKQAVELDPHDPLNFLDLAKAYCGAAQYADAKHVLFGEPTGDVATAVIQYLKTDGELRRVCKPVLADAKN